MNSEFGHQLRHALVELDVHPLDDPVIFGSAVMKLHGIKDEIGDVDLFVTPRAYARLRRTERWWELRPTEHDPPFLEGIGLEQPRAKSFHAFYAWTGRDPWLDVPDAVATAERVGEHLCVRLELVAKWKLEALAWCINNGVVIPGSPWEKHIDDLRLLQDAGIAITRQIIVAERQLPESAYRRELVRRLQDAGISDSMPPGWGTR